MAVGAGIGLVAGSKIPSSVQDTVMAGLGIVVLLMGVKMFFASKNVVLVVAAIALGGILGQALEIPQGFQSFAEWAKHLVGGSGSFTQAVITTSVLYCVGPMTLLGCLQDGVERKIDILAVKSTLDGITAIFFAAAMGAGVLVTAAVVLVVQGTITLCAKPLERFAKDEATVAEVTATGGAILVGTAFGLLRLRELSMAALLPSLPLAAMIALGTKRIKRLTT